jgi:hypothetical protein
MGTVESKPKRGPTMKAARLKRRQLSWSAEYARFADPEDPEFDGHLILLHRRNRS